MQYAPWTDYSLLDYPLRMRVYISMNIEQAPYVIITKSHLIFMHFMVNSANNNVLKYINSLIVTRTHIEHTYKHTHTHLHAHRASSHMHAQRTSNLNSSESHTSMDILQELMHLHCMNVSLCSNSFLLPPRDDPHLFAGCNPIPHLLWKRTLERSLLLNFIMMKTIIKQLIHVNDFMHLDFVGFWVTRSH